MLNALVGDPVLPAGVVPVTSVVTVLRYGTAKGGRVRLSDGKWRDTDVSDLSNYVSEAENPENLKGVEVAEVFLPHPLLASGLCLVDTPGLGSVFGANTATTPSFVPHIDAALVVIGADPPISGEELALIEEISRSVNRMILVLNKADRLSEGERREALRFAAQVLERRLGRAAGPIREVSAAEALERGSPTREMPAVRADLERLAREAGAEIVLQAQLRGIRRLTDRVLAELEEQRESLLRPLTESEQRIEKLRGAAAEAERAARDLKHLFQAEQEALSSSFGAERDRFFAKALDEARGRLDTETARDSGSGLRRKLQTRAIAIAREILEAWLPGMEKLAEQVYAGATARFIELANGFLDRLRSTSDVYAAAPPRPLETERGFRTRRRFYFNELFELAPGTTGLSDLVLGGERARRQAHEYLRKLIEHNTTRIVNDLDERVLESRRTLEAEIRERLHESHNSAVRALERARARKAQGDFAVAAELARIKRLRGRVEALSAGAAQASSADAAQR